MTEFRTEKEFTRWVLKEARSRGWKATHLGSHQVVRTADGPRAVPLSDATGFPDVVAAHPVYGLLFAELKMPRDRVGRRKLSEAQVEWIVALRATEARVFVWYPEDADEIVGVLEGREPTTRLFLEGVLGGEGAWSA